MEEFYIAIDSKERKGMEKSFVNSMKSAILEHDLIPIPTFRLEEKSNKTAFLFGAQPRGEYSKYVQFESLQRAVKAAQEYLALNLKEEY